MVKEIYLPSDVLGRGGGRGRLDSRITPSVYFIFPKDFRKTIEIHDS